MRKPAAFIAVFVMLAIGIAGGCANSSSTPSGTPAVAEPDLQARFFNDSANTMKMCTLYFSLIDQGWTSKQIYDELSTAGAFDKFYGNSGPTFWKEFIRWCYANTN